jgi:hypothetical protein
MRMLKTLISKIAFVCTVFLFCVGPGFANNTSPNAILLSQDSLGIVQGNSYPNKSFSSSVGFSPTISTLFDSITLPLNGSYSNASVYSELPGSNFGLSAYSSGVLARARSDVENNYRFQINVGGTYSLQSFISAGYIEMRHGTTSQYFLPAGNTSGLAYFDWRLDASTAAANIVTNRSFASLVEFERGTSLLYEDRTIGQMLNGYSVGAGRVDWRDTTITTNLGFLNAGTEVNVGIIAQVGANSNRAAQYFSNGGVDPNCGLASNPSNLRDPVSSCGSTTIYFGDPTFLNGPSNSAFLGNAPNLQLVSAVPEPAEWLMLSLGLVLVARIAKRRFVGN